MTQHYDHDDNYIAGEHSAGMATQSMGVGGLGERPHFENISANMVLRSDAPVLGVDSMIGSYRIVRQIGAGGMASVFEAVHVMLSRRAAIKVMHPQLRGESGIDGRMLQEASILDELKHPGIVRVFECDVLPDGRPWIAMELVAGESLGAKLGRDIILSVGEVCNLVSAVADVLATVHPRGIVHRDLKPDNILFADAASGFPLRVIDWGIAHHGSVARLTLDGVTCGTPVYMSPEQAAGHDIAPPCDIYSLGVIAYEALVGEAPFEGRTLGDVIALHLKGDAAPLAGRCSAAPAALCEIVHRMLHKTPSERPSAADVRQTMQRIALEILDDEVEFASFEITSQPVAEVAPPTPAVREMRRVRWTPELSMADGSGYLLVSAKGGWYLPTGDFKIEH